MRHLCRASACSVLHQIIRFFLIIIFQIVSFEIEGFVSIRFSEKMDYCINVQLDTKLKVIVHFLLGAAVFPAAQRESDSSASFQKDYENRGEKRNFSFLRINKDLTEIQLILADSATYL